MISKSIHLITVLKGERRMTMLDCHILWTPQYC